MLVQGRRRESREKEVLEKGFFSCFVYFCNCMYLFFVFVQIGRRNREKNCICFVCIFVFVSFFCICARREEEQGERGFGKVLKLEGDRTFSSAPQRITSV